ncbi:MAG: branched chain amino acid aminotransferase [Geminicoccaceae bacterium]|nr:branched chain amino acid aminotransferase [Geminicoccaceae bacterium]
MTALANERIAYFNGEYLPESQVRVPFRDRSWIFGDGAFDMTRTFNGRVFKLKEHVLRLYRSLKVLRIDPGLSPAEMIDVSRTVLERNLHLLGPDEDYWLGQRISRGVNRVDGDNWDHYGPTVIVECMPLPLKARARLYRDGIDVVVPSVRRVAPDALTPRAKTHNYLNLITADLEVHAHDPEAWTVLLDVNGNLCEGLGANIFVVKDGRLLTPHERYVLPGVSRATAIELAAEEHIPFAEADIDLYDAYTADEVFITSTSFCICPVRSVNGTTIGAGSVPGPITKRLTDAYVRLVDCDFVAQFLKHLA